MEDNVCIMKGMTSKELFIAQIIKKKVKTYFWYVNLRFILMDRKTSVFPMYTGIIRMLGKMLGTAPMEQKFHCGFNGSQINT